MKNLSYFYTDPSLTTSNRFLYNNKLERSGNPDTSGELQGDVSLDWGVMKVEDHFSEIDCELENGGKRIIILFFISLTLLQFSTPLMSQNKPTSKGFSIDSVSGNLLFIYKRQPPGEISGSSLRSLFIFSDIIPSRKSLKRGNFYVQPNDIYVIIDRLMIHVFFSNMHFEDEKQKLDLLFFFNDYNHLVISELNELKVHKKRRNYKINIKENYEAKALLVKTNTSFINSIYRNRVVLLPENKEIKVAILFDNKYIEVLERIIGKN